MYANEVNLNDNEMKEILSERECFLFYEAWVDTLRTIYIKEGADAFANAFLALTYYAELNKTKLDELLPHLTVTGEVLLNLASKQLDADMKKYCARVLKNRENGRKNTKNPVEPSGTQWNPVGSDKEKDNDNDKDNDNENDKGKEKENGKGVGNQDFINESTILKSMSGMSREDQVNLLRNI